MPIANTDEDRCVRVRVCAIDRVDGGGKGRRACGEDTDNQTNFDSIHTHTQH